jgi:hypothetical protein
MSVPGAGTPDPRSRWASLHQDLVGRVASLLLAGDLLDYVRFRAVCTGWRSGTASPRGCGVADPRFHPRRWMMFPEGRPLIRFGPEPRRTATLVRFFNLDTGTLVRVNIPLLGYHRAFESFDGLLLLLRDPDPDRDGGTVRLLNPFTGDTAEFPPLGTLFEQLGLAVNDPAKYDYLITTKVCASISFNNSGGAMTMMLALDHVSRLAYATSLDQQWTLASWECPVRYPPLPFQGKLYIIDTISDFPIPQYLDLHQVFEIDPPVQDHEVQPPKLIATIPARKLRYPAGLVQCGSEVLVLGHNDFSASQILVCKLTDLVLQRFTPTMNIGGNTLFLGERNISVPSKILATVKGDNVIYCRMGERPYLAQYHISSGTLLPAIDNCSLYGLAPGPSSVVLYIFSCCDRYLWCVLYPYRSLFLFWAIY